MEHSTYLYLILILMLIGLIAIFILINILNTIKKQSSNKRGDNGMEEEIAVLKRELSSIKELLSTIGKHIELQTHGVFTATINAKITGKNKNNMEKKIEENNGDANIAPAFDAAATADNSSDSQLLEGTISGSYESKSSGGSGPGDKGGA